ncbi:MAG: hypothetical protein ACFNXZ_00885 [Lautropia mirabilis]
MDIGEGFGVSGVENQGAYVEFTNNSKFGKDLIKAISDWQRGGDRRQNQKRGARLKEVCKSLPEEYRSCCLCCFRQVALPKGDIWSLFYENCLPEKISSWTIDPFVAKSFKGGVPAADSEYKGVVLCVFPRPEEVVVNLSKIYRDPVYLDELDMFKNEILGYHDGAGRYFGSQSEVVLEIESVSPCHVYSLGGYSSSFEELIGYLGEEMYGCPLDKIEYEALIGYLEKFRGETGQRWLSYEGTRRVIKRLEPHVSRLREGGINSQLQHPWLI